MEFRTKFTTLTIAIAFLLAGCSNPASDDDHAEHAEPDKVEFLINGEAVASYTFSTGTTEGSFTVTEGSQTEEITAEFTDENGNEIHAEDLGDEYSLSWDIENADIASLQQSPNNKWAFTITGNAAGNTSVQIMLMHIDHSVFETPLSGTANALSIDVGSQN